MKVFKKDQFTLAIQPKSTGVILSVGNKDGQNDFGLVHPGNNYLLLDGKWELLDSRQISGMSRYYVNHIDLAANALSKAISRVPIKSNLMRLEPKEQLLVEAVIYDMSQQIPLDWLVQADYYDLKKDELVAVSGLNSQPYKLTDNPRVLSRVLDLNKSLIIQPIGSPPVLPSAKKIDSPSKNFAEMVAKRGRYKLENPDWREKENPGYKEEYERVSQADIELSKQLELKEEDPRYAPTLVQSVDSTINSTINSTMNSTMNENDESTLVNDEDPRYAPTLVQSVDSTRNESDDESTLVNEESTLVTSTVIESDDESTLVNDDDSEEETEEITEEMTQEMTQTDIPTLVPSLSLDLLPTLDNEDESSVEESEDDFLN